MVLLVLLACADTSLPPESPPDRPAPADPTETPATPTSGLTLSRPDIVFNLVAGAGADDTAAISVTGSMDALAGLSVETHYAAAGEAAWLAVELDRSAKPITLRVRTRARSLQAGTHAATVRLTAPNTAPDSLTITARVMTGTAIGLNAARICFTTKFNDGSLPRDDVRVTSVDGSPIDGLTAAIEYDAGQPGGWLATSFDGTSAPTRLRLRGTPGALPVGTYNATVLVAAAGAGNSPVPIRVTLTVNPAGPQPGERSVLNIRPTFEGPSYTGVASVQGTSNGGASYDIYCLAGASCSVVLENGIGSVRLFTYAYGGVTQLRWDGACAGNHIGFCTVDFTTPGTTKEVTAVFGAMPAGVGFTLRGAGSGSINSGGAPLNCGPVATNVFCTGTLSPGVGTFTFTPVPATGSLFAGWQLEAVDGNDSLVASCHGMTIPCTFSLASGGHSVGGFASFVPVSATGDHLIIVPAILGVARYGQGIAISEQRLLGPMPPASGTITGPGIDCRINNGVVTGDCEEPMSPGAEIRLLRTPAPGVSCTATPQTEQPGDCETIVTGQQGDLVVNAEFFVQLNSVRIHMRGTGTGVASGAGTCFLLDDRESEVGPIPIGEKGRCFFGRLGAGEHVFRAEPLLSHPGTDFVSWSGDCDANSGRPADFCVVTLTGGGHEVNITATFARRP